MENAELIKTLKEDAEWAHANEWETPITLGDHLDAAAAALRAQGKYHIGDVNEMIPQWISVEDRMPENEQSVLIAVERRMKYSDPPGKIRRFVAKAFYTDGTQNTEDSVYCWNGADAGWEYIEDEDAYLIPKGWWESVDYADEFSAVGDFVTHWQPLPQPPQKGW